jgi:hypothetical protein
LHELISSYSACYGVSHVTEILFSAVPLGFLPENMVTVSDEHVEKLHQDTSQTDKKYIEKWMPNVLAARVSLSETTTGNYKSEKKDKVNVNDFLVVARIPYLEILFIIGLRIL